MNSWALARSSSSPPAHPLGSGAGRRWPAAVKTRSHFFRTSHANTAILSALRILNFRILLINHPDHIEDVLVNHPKKFIKGRILKANKRVFGSGLLTSEGDFWLRQRRLAQPAFHRARIATYASTMVEYTERLLEEWQDGEERDIHKEMMRVTLQIVGKTLFDADVERDAQDVGKSLEMLLEIGADFRRTLFVPHWLPTPTNIRMERAIRQIEKVLYRIIAEKRASGAMRATCSRCCWRRRTKTDRA